MKTINHKLTAWYKIHTLINQSRGNATRDQISEIDQLSQQYLKQYGEPFAYTITPETNDDLA